MRHIRNDGAENQLIPARGYWRDWSRHLSGVALLAVWVGIAALFVIFAWNESLLDPVLDWIGILATRWHLAIPDYVEVFVVRHAPRLLVLVISLVPVLLFETWVVGYQNSSMGRLFSGRSVSATYDLAIFALVLCGLWTFLSVVLGFGMSWLLEQMNHSMPTDRSIHDLKIRTGSFWGDLSLYFVALTFFDYWTHRLFHMKPLWYLHRMHHSATEMTVLTLWRGHPAAPVVESVLRTWPLALFDMSAACTALIAYFVVSYEYLIHSNLPWTWGWFGRWVLIPPAGHRIHHSSDPAHVSVNLGIVVLWDRLFGTWRGSGIGTESIGVVGVPYNSGRYLEEAWRDLLVFLRALLKMGTRARGVTIARP